MPPDETTILLDAASFPTNDAATTTLHKPADDHDNHSQNDLSTNSQMTVTLIKTCMGMGCLALPLACRQGGFFLFGFLLLVAALWNAYSVQLLIQCLDYLPPRQHTNCNNSKSTSDDEESSGPSAETNAAPTNNTTVLNQVARAAYGLIGVTVADFVMMILFVGVITAWFCAILTFAKDVFGPATASLQALGAWWVVAAASSVPHMGALKHVTAAGLWVLLLAFGVIVGYGLRGDTDTAASTTNLAALWWPSLGSLGALGQLFGVVVFGFGIVPMTYNYHSGMQRPQDIVQVTYRALLMTAILYWLAGFGLLWLFADYYYNDTQQEDSDKDILSALPATGWLPALTRLAMMMMIALTAPVLVVPCAELVHGKMLQFSTSRVQVPLPVVRVVICGMAGWLAFHFPDFVQTLALVGSTCAAAVSFILPAWLHYGLAGYRRTDGALLLLGTGLTLASTYFILQ